MTSTINWQCLCIDTKIVSEIKNIAKIKALEFIDPKFVIYSPNDFTNLQTKTPNFQESVNQSDSIDKKTKQTQKTSPYPFQNCWKFRTRQWEFVKPCVEQLKTLKDIRGVINGKAGKAAALGVVHKLHLQEKVGRWSKNVAFCQRS